MACLLILFHILMWFCGLSSLWQPDFTVPCNWRSLWQPDFAVLCDWRSLRQPDLRRPAVRAIYSS